ncbi:MAG: Crp/Fnr family transcriptional regulator [Chitinophagales bacterium]
MNDQSHNCLTCSVRHCTILKKCRREFLELINCSKYCIKYQRGQPLIVEGKEADGIYVINSGVVKVHVSSYKNKPFILFLGTVGDMLGYQIDPNNRYQVSVTAVEETHVCFIERKYFENVLNKNVAVRDDLRQTLNNELSNIYLRTVRLAQMNVSEKIAEVLLHIADAYQLNYSTGRFTVNLSRQDIGDIVGLNKEQVSKCLSDLKTQKVIAASGKDLQILNYKKLEELIGK